MPMMQMQEMFQRIDIHLDLTMTAMLSGLPKWSYEEYKSDWPQLYKLPISGRKLIDREFCYKSCKDILRSERRSCISVSRLNKVITLFHSLRGHMQTNRKFNAFQKKFHCALR